VPSQVLSGAEGKYVQDVLAAQAALPDPGAAAVVLCGHKDMCNAVKEQLAAQGVAAERMLLNF
jgi:ferredoxin-NADP reductase